jgi:Protein of unknown function (DUF2628)
MREQVPPIEAAVIGTGAQGFWDTFQAFKVGNVEQFAPTWNWPAFFLGGFWYLYRKVYLWAGVTIGLSVLSAIPYIGAGIGLVTLIGNAVVANYLYYLHVKEQAQKVRNSAVDESEALKIAQQLGGVNIWAIWFFAGFLVVVFIGAFISASM